MNWPEFPNFDWRLVLTAVGMSLFRAWTSEDKTFRASATIVVFSLFSAWVFTEPVLWLTGWPREVFLYPICAAVALTGERVMRMLLRSIDNTDIWSLWDRWRGGGGNNADL